MEMTNVEMTNVEMTNVEMTNVEMVTFTVSSTQTLALGRSDGDLRKWLKQRRFGWFGWVITFLVSTSVLELLVGRLSFCRAVYRSQT